jgi:hypothetical protein
MAERSTGAWKCGGGEGRGAAFGPKRSQTGLRISAMSNAMQTSFALMALLCASLSGCAPAGVPWGASVQWSLKEGFYWTWTQRLEHGCVAWMAKDEWASVILLINAECEGEREHGNIDGQGLSYLSGHHLIFRGFWSWTSDDYFERIIYNGEGMISEILLCPHSLSSDQIGAMRMVAQEALAEAASDRERRVLARIDERLAATNGEALASGQFGCTDLPPDWRTNSDWDQDPWER